MRSLALGSLLLLAPTAHADKRAHKKANATATAAADEPMPAAATPPASLDDEIKVQELNTRGTDAPQPKVITRDTPTPMAVGVQTSLPDAVMHQPPTAPPDASAAAPSSLTDDAVLELAAHQMRHERKPLDACAAEAQRRNPTATGSVTLRFTVADRKVVSVLVDKDTLHDTALTSCLTTAGRSLNFTLKQASFYWPVSLSSPTASR
jgi:hypothetical protein